MSDKDINIHVRTQDVPQSKAQLDSFAKSAEELLQGLKSYRTETDAASKSSEVLGNTIEKAKEQTQAAAKSQEELAKKTSDSQNTVGIATEKASEKINKQDKSFVNLKSKLLSFLGATAGFSAFLSLLDQAIEKLQRVRKLTEDFHDLNVRASASGQKFEFQTGTVGQAKEWGIKQLQLQGAGGWNDTAIPKALMENVDKQFSKEGGIQNKKIMDFLMQIAPALGAGGFTEQEINSLFQIGDKAKISPTAAAYKELIAQIRATAKAGKLTPNELLADTESSNALIRYMSAGGSLKQGLSLYLSGREVSANKRGGNTLLDLVTQITSSENKEVMRAIERSQHVKLQQLSKDEQAKAVLRHINSLPEKRRVQLLKDQGFGSPEDLALLATPDAQEIYEDTQIAFSNAKKEDIQPMQDAYRQSTPFKEASNKAQSEVQKIQTETPTQSAWETRLKLAKDMADIKIQAGKDSKLVADDYEDVYAAYEMMISEAESLLKKYKGTKFEYEIWDLTRQLRAAPIMMKTPFLRAVAPILKNEGQFYEEKLANLRQKTSQTSDLSLPQNMPPSVTDMIPFLNEPWNKPFAPAQPQNGPVVINHSNDNSVNIYPSIGATEFNRMDFNE